MRTILLLCLFALTACSGQPKKKENQRIITVTIEPQRYFAEAIAGDKFEIVSMVPKGSSPETYDPTPRQLTMLTKSEAYLRIGHIGFELNWMDRLLKNAPHLKVFDTSEGIELIHSNERVHGDHIHSEGVDPHIWNSTLNARLIASNICKALCALDKENEAHYVARYNSLDQIIRQTDNEILQLLDEGADKAFLIFHPALSYFARDYGLKQFSIEEDGKEPSPAHLKKVIETCHKEKIRVIFVQPEFDQRNAEVIAQQTGIRITPINPLSYYWPDEMIHIASNLKHEK